MAKVLKLITRDSGAFTEIAHQLKRQGIVQMAKHKGWICIGRHGTNKSTLKNLLKEYAG